MAFSVPRLVHADSHAAQNGQDIRDGELSSKGMTPDDDRPRRRGAPPERGWTLGADGLPRAAWGLLALLLCALSVILFVLGYYGYGALVMVLAGAAGVNVW